MCRPKDSLLGQFRAHDNPELRHGVHRIWLCNDRTWPSQDQDVLPCCSIGSPLFRLLSTEKVYLYPLEGRGSGLSGSAGSQGPAAQAVEARGPLLGEEAGQGVGVGLGCTTSLHRESSILSEQGESGKVVCPLCQPATSLSAVQMTATNWPKQDGADVTVMVLKTTLSESYPRGEKVWGGAVPRQPVFMSIFPGHERRGDQYLVASAEVEGLELQHLLLAQCSMCGSPLGGLTLLLLGCQLLQKPYALSDVCVLCPRQNR